MGMSSSVAPSSKLQLELRASEIGELEWGVHHVVIRNDEIVAVNLARKRLKPGDAWDMFDTRHSEKLR
jgi:hypothetical protein